MSKTHSPDKLKKLLVFDIETVSAQDKFEKLDDRLQSLWAKKSAQINRYAEEDFSDEFIANSYADKAGIYAEFAKIVCISVGVFIIEDGEVQRVRTKSFASHDEGEILDLFFDLLETHFNDPLTHQIAGHNIREFDIPFVCRRALVNGRFLPKLFQVQGKRPWQMDYVYDSMDMWRFGDYKHYTSLDLLAAMFDIPTPKDDIDGSMVSQIYWQEGDLNRIISYCEKDIVTSCKVLMHLLQINYDENLEIVSLSSEEEEE